MALGVGESGRVPLVWSFPSRMMFRRGSWPSASNFRNSSSQMSTRLLSGMKVS